MLELHLVLRCTNIVENSAPWCNGSTGDFGSLCPSSNLGGAIQERSTLCQNEVLDPVENLEAERRENLGVLKRINLVFADPEEKTNIHHPRHLMMGVVC